MFIDRLLYVESLYAGIVQSPELGPGGSVEARCLLTLGACHLAEGGRQG